MIKCKICNQYGIRDYGDTYCGVCHKQYEADLKDKRIPKAFQAHPEDYTYENWREVRLAIKKESEGSMTEEELKLDIEALAEGARTNRENKAIEEKQKEEQRRDQQEVFKKYPSSIF